MFRGIVVEVPRAELPEPVVILRPDGEAGLLEPGDRLWILGEPHIVATVKSVAMPQRLSPATIAQRHDVSVVLDCDIAIGNVDPGTRIESAPHDVVPPMRVHIQARGVERFWANLTAAQVAGIPVDGAASSVVDPDESLDGADVVMTVVVFENWHNTAGFLAPRLSAWVKACADVLSIQLLEAEWLAQPPHRFRIDAPDPQQVAVAVRLAPDFVEKRPGGAYRWSHELRRWIREDDDEGTHDRAPVSPRPPQLAEGAEANLGEDDS